jgi:hypothetical protein
MSHDIDETRATARLPNLEVELIHRRSPDASAEEITVRIRAFPSFAAFTEALESANPFLFWTRMFELAWQPWLATFTPRLEGPKR